MKRIHASNKNHNLFIRGSKIWFKFVLQGKQIVISTGLRPSGSSGWKEARLLRDHWIAGIKRDGPSFVERQKPKHEIKPVTCEEIFEVYSYANDISPFTIRDNKAVIRKILRYSNLSTNSPVEILNKIVPH
jgi:hypothetical protein